MRPDGPTFWRLDGATGWRASEAADEAATAATVRECPQSGLRLRIDPHGPLGLASEDGSLGRLTLPRGVAIDACGALYLLDLDTTSVRRFDPERGTFIDLPIELEGEDPAGFSALGNLAAVGRDLYLADPTRSQLRVIDPSTWGLRHLWGPEVFGAGGEIADVTEHRGMGYVLDRARGAVYRHRPGAGELERLFARREGAGRWRRLAIDRDGRFYLLAVPDSAFEAGFADDWKAAARLEVVGASGELLEEIEESDEVRSLFPKPALELDHQGRLRPPAACYGQLAARREAAFTRQGQAVAIASAEPPGPPAYVAEGIWHSTALDSEIHLCEWHLLDLGLQSLPAGSVVEIATFSDQVRRTDAEIETLPEALWSHDLRADGPMQPPPGAEVGGSQPVIGLDHDALVQSRTGRYLWLRLRLLSDGYDTPRVRALRVHYPRQTYLEDLPAVFAGDEASRGFLNRFLAIFHSEWSDLEHRIDQISRYFDPRSVPEGELMAYLAGWLGQPLEASWPARWQRRLLAAVPGILPRRGTVSGLRSFLAVYLAQSSGVEPEDQLGFPRLIEGYRERRFLRLGAGGETPPAPTMPLWSRSRVARAQLDRGGREGEVRLVSTGEPRRDPFDQHAHRFRVFVPAAWIPDAETERSLHRALRYEKPAHSRYDLCLVEPRMRVGVQATVGVDTIIGAVPRLRLAPLDDPEAPPSRPPRHRLGYDSVLSAALPPPATNPPNLVTGGIP